LYVTHNLHEGGIFEEMLAIFKDVLVELIRDDADCIAQSESCESELLLLVLSGSSLFVSFESILMS
jgi:hypothetical protein